MVSGSRPRPSKSSSAHRGGKLAYAARKQRAIFSAQRLSLNPRKTKHPNRFRYLEKAYGGKNGSISYYSRVQRGWDHYDGRKQRGGRGRQKERQSDWRVQRRRSSRSMSPTARDRHDAVQDDAAYFDYGKPGGECPDFRSYGPGKPRYDNNETEEFGDDEQGDEWEDELQVLDALDGRDGAHRSGKVKKAELEYLKRMLTRLRNRHKELFSHRSGEKLSRERGILHHNRNDDMYGKKPSAPPSSPNRPHGRSRSSNSHARCGKSPRRHYRSLEGTKTSDSYHYGTGKSQRRYSYTHGESKISQMAPISNQLKAAVSTRTYPSRTFGRALHVQRWLSDRYTKQSTFNFGELPRSEGVKKYYILDPNDPDKYINVPRPGQPAPGTRGDYYRGAAWDAYQREKQEWLETQGCNYPDAWVSAGAAGDTSMAGSGHESGDIMGVDASMSNAGSDTTVRAQQETRRNSFNNRQATPDDEMDTASETSEDLISLGTDNGNGVLLPALLDPRIADISSMIQQTTIIDYQASIIPAAGAPLAPDLPALMPFTKVAQAETAVEQPAPLITLAAATPANGEICQVANPTTAASRTNPSIPQPPPAIGNMEQQTVSLPLTAIAPAAPLPTTTATPAIATAPASAANQAAISTTIPGLGLLRTTVIIPDEDWNKEWEDEWRYHF